LILKIVFQYVKVSLLFLVLFEISRLYFVIYNASYFDESLLFVFVQTAYKGFRLDLSTIAYCTSPFLFISLLENVSRRKSPLWIINGLLLLEMLAIVLITIADAELFIQWGNKFNNQVLVYITHPLEMALSAGSANFGKTLLFLLFAILICFFLFKALSKNLTALKDHKPSNAIIILVLLGLNFIWVRGGVGVATISQSSAIYSDKNANNAAAVNSLWNALYYIVNNTDYIYGKSYLYKDEKQASEEFKKQISGKPDSFFFSKSDRPNVIIVMLESFTASASNFFSGHNNCTPYLDSLAKQNLAFMQCYASGDRTEKGLVSVLSGYPAQPASSIIVFPDKMQKLPSLGKVFKPLGYQNLFMYGGDAEFAAMKSYLLIHGFNKVIDKKDFSKKQLNSKWGAHDAYLYEKTLEELKSTNSPFLTVLLSLSSHEPFDVPYESKDIKRDKWYGYKNSIRYADHCLFEFIEACKKQSWYDNTIIVLVADHGHDIGLENIFFFGREKYHIPLIIAGGALRDDYKGKQIQNVVSQTIIPHLLLEGFKLDTKGFEWQTGVNDPNGFAQYHYNNGFGRVSKYSECVSDNLIPSYYFKGQSKDSLQLRHDGRIFQQILIDDFLKK
jgi:phosphoglycerol transferase MdoB-like AlkP superfamily enzyme